MSVLMVSSTSSGISSSSESSKLASLASRASGLRSLKSINLMSFDDGDDETLDAEVTSEVVGSEPWAPVETVAIEAISISVKYLGF